MLLVMCFAVCLNMYANTVAGIFTKDVKTIAIIVDILPALSLFVVLDSLHGV